MNDVNQEGTMAVAETAETIKAQTFRGSMKKVVEYLNATPEIRTTPEELAEKLNVPGMTAYRALKFAVANGSMKIEKVTRDKGERRGPNKNMFISA